MTQSIMQPIKSTQTKLPYRHFFAFVKKSRIRNFGNQTLLKFLNNPILIKAIYKHFETKHDKEKNFLWP